MKILRSLSLAFLFVSIALFLSCSGKTGNNQETNQNVAIPAVEAVQTKYGSLPLTERLSGIVKAKNQVEIFPEISATIQKVFVQNGDSVSHGQILIELRDKEYRERLKQAKASYQIAAAQVKQAEAQLREIQSELNRTKSLAEKKLVSDTQLEAIKTRAVSAEADLELARARVEQAQATVDEREENLSQTVVRAPVSGVVGNRNAEVGMLVSSNTQLFTLGKLDTVKVEVILTDRMLDYIETGQRSEIAKESGSLQPVSAPISRVSPFLNPITHSTTAEIDLPNPGHRLKSGMFVTVDIFYGESESATLVPLSTLYEHPSTGVTGVYVAQSAMTRELAGSSTSNGTIALTNPIAYEFVPVDVIAKGRMSAGIRGVAQGKWVVTIGQELFGGESREARTRPIDWERVEYLQQLQRQDMMEEVMKRQQADEGKNGANAKSTSTSS